MQNMNLEYSIFKKIFKLEIGEFSACVVVAGFFCRFKDSTFICQLEEEVLPKMRRFERFKLVWNIRFCNGNSKEGIKTLCYERKRGPRGSCFYRHEKKMILHLRVTKI